MSSNEKSHETHFIGLDVSTRFYIVIIVGLLRFEDLKNLVLNG